MFSACATVSRLPSLLRKKSSRIVWAARLGPLTASLTQPRARPLLARISGFILERNWRLAPRLRPWEQRSTGSCAGDPPRRLQLVAPRFRAPMPAIDAFGGLAPASHQSGFEPEQVENTAQRLIDHLVESLRLGVKGGNRRSDHRPHFRQRRHGPQ